MASKTSREGRIVSAVSNRSLLIIMGPVLFIALISIVVAYPLTPPDHLVMTTGFEGGLTQNLASATGEQGEKPAPEG